jgi:hypothetical protein
MLIEHSDVFELITEAGSVWISKDDEEELDKYGEVAYPFEDDDLP